MSEKPKLQLENKADAFFQELVESTLSQQKVRVRPETSFYLVNLLSQFLFTENLFTRDQNGNMKEEPLALLFKDALEAPTPDAQRALFRHIGDVSLYRAGFFQDSLYRKLVDIDYYIGMGGGAYSQAASRANESTKSIFEDLAGRFSAFVDVLAEVSEKTNHSTKNETDILRTYDLWVKTGSNRAKSALKRAGIDPELQSKMNPKKKDIQ